MSEKTPPVGLRPRWLAEESRRTEIESAIRRYIDAAMEIPAAWMEEWLEVDKRIAFCRKLSDERIACGSATQKSPFRQAIPLRKTGVFDKPARAQIGAEWTSAADCLPDDRFINDYLLVDDGKDIKVVRWDAFDCPPFGRIPMVRWKRLPDGCCRNCGAVKNQ